MLSLIGWLNKLISSLASPGMGHGVRAPSTYDILIFATLLWNYTKYDSDLLYQISSEFCVPQLYFFHFIEKCSRLSVFKHGVCVFRVILCLSLKLFPCLLYFFLCKILAIPLN